MAQLRNLGMPFGSPGGIINIPAPAGSGYAGIQQMQAMQGLGQGLGMYLGQKQAEQNLQENLRRIQSMGPQQNILNTMYGARGMQLPQAQMPTMIGPRAQEMQLQGLMGQIFAKPSPLRAIGTGEVTSIFDPTTGQITPTEHPSARVATTSVSIKPPPSQMMEKLSSAYEFQAKLGDIDGLFDPNVVGPVLGRWAGVREKYNIPFTEAPTSNQIVFRQITEMIGDDLVRLRSGAAISIPEYNRLMKMMPEPNLPPKTFKAKVRGLRLAFDRMVKAKQRILRETGYIVPGETQLPSTNNLRAPRQQSDIRNMSDEELRRIAGER